MEELKKERHQLEDASTKLISEALRAGAESAEVCGSYGQKSKIALEKQDFHLASTDDGYQFGIRVLKGQKQGFASCNTLDPKDLKEMAQRAVEIASFSPENPHYSIVAAAQSSRDVALPLWDSALSKISLQTQKDLALWMAKETMKDSRIRLNEGTVAVGSGLLLVVNSKGTHQVEAETACSWSLMGMAVEGDNITSFDYFSELSRKAAGIGDRIVKSAATFRESLLKNLKTGYAENYKGLVVFSPRAVIDIILDSLSYHLNGRVLTEGSGKWKLADLDKELLHPGLTLTDRPWLIDRAGCTLFDREGTPTRDLKLIEKGALKSFLFDNYSAKALHQTSTGHAAGGPTAIPTVGTHALCLAGGVESLAALLDRAYKTQKKILWVNRYSGQTDPVTGDFSGVAKGGEWWVDGEFESCVKETLISGNFFDCVGRSLFGISKETQVVDSSEETPTIVLDGISVTTN